VGCAWLARRPEAPPPAAGAAPDSPQALIDLVSARRAAVKSLRATGKLQVTVDARRGADIRRNRFTASQAILAQSPSSFRLEALSPFGVAYAVASDGRELAVLIPSESVVYRGAAELGTVAAATGVAATPEDVTELLLGLPPAPELDLEHAWVSHPGSPGMGGDGSDGPIAPEILLHATARDDPDDLVVVGFATIAATGSLEPVLYERITGQGQLVLRARFGAYRAMPAGPFATRVEIQAIDSEAVLTYSDVDVNPALEASRFAVATPSGARVLRLDASGRVAAQDPA